jgi:hypothetical protein
MNMNSLLDQTEALFLSTKEERAGSLMKSADGTMDVLDAFEGAWPQHWSAVWPCAGNGAPLLGGGLCSVARIHLF